MDDDTDYVRFGSGPFNEARERLRLIPDEIGTVALVREYVEAIRTIRADDEVAHASEDQLWRGVLKAIASGSHEDDADDLCAAALETKHIKFYRWCS